MSDERMALKPEHLETVRSILRHHVPDRDVWIVGSRARGDAKPWSDLDLVVLGDDPPEFRTAGLLHDAFEESDLPWKVDLLWWAHTDSTFRRILERDRVPVQRGSARAA